MENAKNSTRAIAERDAAVASRDAEKERADAATERLRQTVRNLKAMNIPLDQIATATGLSSAEIAGIS